MIAKGLLENKRIVIASYTHIIKGEFTTIGGPGLALKNYIKDRAEYLMCIWQPMPISDTLSIIVEKCEQGKNINTLRLPVINWPFGRKKAISFIYIFLKLRDIFSVLFIIILRNEFDIFIGVEALNALVGVFLRKLGVVKKVIYYNLDYGKNRFPVPLLNSIFHFLDRLAVGYADATWCLSEQMIRERKKKGVINKNQIVVPIGIEFSRIKRLSLEAIDRKSIVYLGVLMEQQGVQLLVEAFPEVLNNNPEVKLSIIGSGEFELNLRKMVEEYGLEDRIKFTGIVSDEEVERLLCSSYIGVAPYWDDPYSNKRFTEPTKPKTYLACGLPVVITRVPSIASEIEKEKAGIVINYKKEELAEAINKLLSDEALYKEYRSNAIKFASKYDWKNIFDNAFESSLRE